MTTTTARPKVIKAPKGMKKGWRYAIAIVVALALLAGVGVLLRLAGKGWMARPYDASQPTAQKFAQIVRWAPPAAEFDVAVDVQRLLAAPELSARLAGIVKGQSGLAAEFVAALLEKQQVVGMLMLTGTLGAPGSEPLVAVVAQGGFDEKTFIPAIRQILAGGQAGLVAEAVAGRTLYVESDAREPFGFMILDGEHIAVGTRAALAALFAGGPQAAGPAPAIPDAVLFGHLTVGPRVAALLPPGLPQVPRIEFASADGTSLVATIPGGTIPQAQDLRMFLEGSRSLLMLQEEGNAALERILKGVAIDNRDGAVTIRCDILPLLDLWVPAKEAEALPTPEGTEE